MEEVQRSIGKMAHATNGNSGDPPAISSATREELYMIAAIMDEEGGEDDLYREWQERISRMFQQHMEDREQQLEHDHMLLDEPHGDEEQEHMEDQLQQHLNAEREELEYRVDMVAEHMFEARQERVQERTLRIVEQQQVQRMLAADGIYTGTAASAEDVTAGVYRAARAQRRMQDIQQDNAAWVETHAAGEAQMPPTPGDQRYERMAAAIGLEVVGDVQARQGVDERARWRSHLLDTTEPHRRDEDRVALAEREGRQIAVVDMGMHQAWGPMNIMAVVQGRQVEVQVTNMGHCTLTEVVQAAIDHSLDLAMDHGINWRAHGGGRPSVVVADSGLALPQGEWSMPAAVLVLRRGRRLRLIQE